MARTTAQLSAGPRLADHISLGVLTAQVPIETVQDVLAHTGRASQRERDLPAHVMVYYTIALALYADVSTREVLRCLLEGARWLGDPLTVREPPGKSAISQARTRLGAAPLEALYRRVVAPVAEPGTPGAWYRGWRVMSLDGTTLDLPDTAANARAFGRPPSPRGANATGAFPQLRLVGLVETGTHVLCAAQLGRYRTSERTLAAQVLPTLQPDMLCLADRGFLGFDLWRAAAATGAALLWRASATFTLPVLERYADGSYRSALRWNAQCTSRHRTPIPVRVIEYTLPGVPGAEAAYRVVTTILDPAQAPAAELAALYHERWEIETAFDEFKTHLRGAQRVLRSKTPELVRQEVWGFLLAHFALRALMHEAALGAEPRARDPDTLSFTHALRVTRRTLPHWAALSPSGPAPRPPGAAARAAGRGRRVQSRARRAARRQTQDERLSAPTAAPARHAPRDISHPST
jgi:hypothetical protein